MVSFPLLISFSLGAILGIAISFGILFFSNIRSFFMKKKVARVYDGDHAAVNQTTIILLYLAYPGNPFFLRIKNIIRRNRYLFQRQVIRFLSSCMDVAREKNIYFGVGLDMKLLGAEIWNAFYNTVFDVSEIQPFPMQLPKHLLFRYRRVADPLWPGMVFFLQY